MTYNLEILRRWLDTRKANGNGRKLGETVDALVNDIMDFATFAANEVKQAEKRGTESTWYKLLAYAQADIEAPASLAGGHCGDRVDMWYEAHEHSLNELAGLFSTGEGDDGMDLLLPALEQAKDLIQMIHKVEVARGETETSADYWGWGRY